MMDVHAESTGAAMLRAGHSAPTQEALRVQIRKDRVQLYTLDSSFLANFYNCEVRVGTKVARLLLEIDAMISKDERSKCVVFSQYVGLLDVVAGELEVREIGFSRIDEHMKQHERADALLEFTNDPKAKVFLLSMRNGAGLNLTVADHCFLLDVAPNSAIEEQSIDRIHRIGQTRPVTVKRFVIENTAEERLLGVRRALAIDRPSEGTQVCGRSFGFVHGRRTHLEETLTHGRTAGNLRRECQAPAAHRNTGDSLWMLPADCPQSLSSG